MGREKLSEGAESSVNDLSADQLFTGLYSELKSIARRRMANERPGNTLQATALIHEAWLRLNKGGNIAWQTEDELIAAASVTMRRILIDRARKKMAIKNGGNLRRTSLSGNEFALHSDSAADIIDVEIQLKKFAGIHPDKAQLVELRFFAGMTIKEIAVLRGVSEKTVKRHWVYARAWLFDAIQSSRTMNSDEN